MSDAIDPTEPRNEIPRRGFFKKVLAMVLGGVAVAVPGAAALMVFLDPLRRGGAGGAFVPVGPLDAVPPDGSPRRFQIIADRADAWTRHRNVPLGAVYVKRETTAGGEPKLVAFNAVCPHAGCFVDVDADGRSFICPCHNSGFHPDGSKKPGCVSPRPLDTLEVDQEALAEGLVRVRFQNFVAGTHDKKAV